MKKILILIATIFMCFAFCSCAGEASIQKKTKPFLNERQEIINICCQYSRVNKVRGFEVGTSNRTEIEDGYIVKAKGSYFPVDEYGDAGDYMLYDIEFTATWDGESDYYNIRVTDQYIRSKY